MAMSVLRWLCQEIYLWKQLSNKQIKQRDLNSQHIDFESNIPFIELMSLLLLPVSSDIFLCKILPDDSCWIIEVQNVNM